MNGYTPTEFRILQLLRDGLPHRREEVHACLDDDLSALRSITPHLTRLRKKIQPAGQDILAVTTGRITFYQQVRLLNSANDGRT